MKQNIVLSITTLLCLAVACTVSKQTTSSNSSSTSATKSKNGVYNPSSKELAAIQKQDPTMSMGKLQEGYALYRGVCTNCHGTKNIYRFSVAEWKEIINDMAPKARLNDLQKDAVYKYVLAIKATEKQ